MDILNQGSSFDLWSPAFDEEAFNFKWMLRGYEEHEYLDKVGHLYATRNGVFAAGIWGQIVLVSFNIVRAVAMDLANRLTRVDARWLNKIAAILGGACMAV